MCDSLGSSSRVPHQLLRPWSLSLSGKKPRFGNKARFFIFGTIEGMKWNISTLEELQGVAKEIYQTLEKDSEHATLLTLKGDLGAGKTAFTKELAKVLGIEEHITSPTFVLAKEYDLIDQKFEKLIHIDAYRLEGEEGLEPINFEELLKNQNNLIVLEWPERVEDELPDFEKRIEIKLEGESRNITYGS